MCLIVAQIGVAIPKFRHARQYLAFGLPLIPANIAQWIVDSSDRYLIAFFLGATAVGYYSPGYAIGNTLSMVAAPLMTLLLPVLSKHYDYDQIIEVRTVLTYSLKYYSAIVLPCVFALSVLSMPILLILTTQQIAENGYLVTPLVAAGAALIGASTMFANILALKEKTTIYGTIWIISALLNLGLNVVLIPYLGLIGAALATFLAFLFAFVSSSRYSLRQFTFDVNSGFIVKSICAWSIMSIVLLLWSLSGLLSIVLSIALGAIIYLTILLVVRGLTIQEIKFIYRIFKGS